jgi:hypothetical protein
MGVNASLLSNDVEHARKIGGQQKVIEQELTDEGNYQSTVAALQNARDGLLKYTMGEGKDQLAAASGGWSRFRNIPSLGMTGVNETRADVMKNINSLVNQYLQLLRQSGVGTSAFNSDKEGERLATAVSELAQGDWHKYGDDFVQNKVQSLITDIDEKIALIQAQRDKKVAAENQMAPNVIPHSGGAPKRGQSINARQYGFPGM